MILYDSDWNPQQDLQVRLSYDFLFLFYLVLTLFLSFYSLLRVTAILQAISRAHRIGQTKTVLVLRLITTGRQ